MFRMTRLVVTCLLVRTAPGWWGGDGQLPRDEARPDTRQAFEKYTSWVSNQTFPSNFTMADRVGISTSGWDGWLWTACDTLVGILGWLTFGNSWARVRTGFSLVIRLTVILFVRVVAHFLFALFWPVVSLLMGILLTAVWVVRTLLKCCWRAVYPVAPNANFVFGIRHRGGP